MSFIHEIAVHIPYIQILQEDGRLSELCPPSWPSPEFTHQAYRHLCLTRLFDQRAIALQRTGQLGTYASCLGQEAVSTGIGLAMHAHDILVPYYRDQAAQMLRGIRLEEILQYWGGDEAGNCYREQKKDLPNCVPIATQITHAAGVATAARIHDTGHAVVTTCGDGATSRGDFYEPLNLAGVWHLPLVIVINNNQWAISVPRSAQTAAQTLAQKAVAAGIPGVQVDGNDVLAMYLVLEEALARARAGKGPTLIEAVTFRLCDHTTADDMRRYCDTRKITEAWQHEPVARLRRYLELQGWTDEQDQSLQQALKQEVETAVQAYLSLPPPQPADMFDYLYAELPDELIAQRQAVIDRAGDPHE